ncbi:MAG: hypothetical protein WA303_13570 [Bradyrhizobium sp.]
MKKIAIALATAAGVALAIPAANADDARIGVGVGPVGAGVTVGESHDHDRDRTTIIKKEEAAWPDHDHQERTRGSAGPGHCEGTRPRLTDFKSLAPSARLFLHGRPRP